jgi:hypothetical protein
LLLNTIYFRKIGVPEVVKNSRNSIDCVRKTVQSLSLISNSTHPQNCHNPKNFRAKNVPVAVLLQTNDSTLKDDYIIRVSEVAMSGTDSKVLFIPFGR